MKIDDAEDAEDADAEGRRYLIQSESNIYKV